MKSRATLQGTKGAPDAENGSGKGCTVRKYPTRKDVRKADSSSLPAHVAGVVWQPAGYSSSPSTQGSDRLRSAQVAQCPKYTGAVSDEQQHHLYAYANLTPERSAKCAQKPAPQR